MLRFLCLMRTPPRVGFLFFGAASGKGESRTPNGSATKKRSGTGGRRRRGDESATQVFEARRNGSRLRPAVRAGRASPRVKTRARSLQPICVARSPEAPLPAPTVREREPGEAKGRSTNPPAPSAPPLLAVGGEGGVAAPRARHPRRHKSLTSCTVRSLSLSFSSSTSTLKALSSCLLACLCLYARP